MEVHEHCPALIWNYRDESEIGCDGVPNSGLINDVCGVCGGNNSTCIDNCGIPNGDNITCADINNDNSVNVTDVIFLVNLVISQSTSSVGDINNDNTCLLYTSPSPRDGLLSRMPSSA